MILLEVWHNDNKTSEFLSDKKSLAIGRAPECDIVINDPSISREHAEIEQRNSTYYIRDLDSKNGVIVNKETVLECSLHNDDRIRLGETEIVFSVLHQKRTTPSENLMVKVEDVPLTSEILEQHIQPETGNQAIDKAASSDSYIEQLNARIRIHLELDELLRDSSLTLDDLLYQILAYIIKEVSFDIGSIFIKDSLRETLVPRAIYRNPDSDESSARISRTIINACYDNSTAVISADASRDPRFRESESIAKYEIHSVMCIPLIGRESSPGVLYICGKEPEEPYSEKDLNFLLAISREITLGVENFILRENMKRQERMASIGVTIAGLSHYLKNILLVAEGSFSLLEDAVQEESIEKIKKFWSSLKDNNQKLTELIQDMLLYARAKPSVYSRENINVLLQQISRTLEPRLNKNNISLSLDLDESIGMCWLDAHGLYRSLLNLIINAIESFEDEHDGDILLTSEIDPENNNLLLTVQDNGSGIDPEDLPHIYEPFFSTKSGKGTGLGLALTKRLVKEWGGTLECDSKPGVGTTFIFRLPILDEPPERLPERPDFYTPFME